MAITDTLSHMELYDKIRLGDRIALSRAITLVESRQSDHVETANALLDTCMRNTPEQTSMRVAVSGAPGVGKSTFIESVSSHILEAGHRLAVLAVDPSSQLSGGSILGDKTRMHTLSAHPNAFVRPSPAGSHPGGVAERTREATLLCETAGFDVIIVETVGVGQSETQVRTMVDLLLLLISPGGGDEVQGIKRGILELADLVVVNKADGALASQARETMGQYTHALRVLFSQGQAPDVLSCSSLEGSGVSAAWQALSTLFENMSAHDLADIRSQQEQTWFKERLRQLVVERFITHHRFLSEYDKKLAQIAQRELSVRTALAEMTALTDALLSGRGEQI